MERSVSVHYNNQNLRRAKGVNQKIIPKEFLCNSLSSESKRIKFEILI